MGGITVAVSKRRRLAFTNYNRQDENYSFEWQELKKNWGPAFDLRSIEKTLNGALLQRYKAKQSNWNVSNGFDYIRNNRPLQNYVLQPCWMDQQSKCARDTWNASSYSTSRLSLLWWHSSVASWGKSCDILCGQFDWKVIKEQTRAIL